MREALMAIVRLRRRKALRKLIVANFLVGGTRPKKTGSGYPEPALRVSERCQQPRSSAAELMVRTATSNPIQSCEARRRQILRCPLRYGPAVRPAPYR